MRLNNWSIAASYSMIVAGISQADVVTQIDVRVTDKSNDYARDAARLLSRTDGRDQCQKPSC